MSRLSHFNYIEQQLSTLGYRLEMRGKVNILDMHLHSESFYQHLFNALFGWNLRNQNTVQRNSAGVDLVDDTNRFVIQVSATATKQKIEAALAKDLSSFKGYSFKFISIVRSAELLRTGSYVNPHGLIFDPVKDIYDLPALLSIIQSMHIDQLTSISDLIRKELNNNPDFDKVETNLTAIIKILSKEDLSHGAQKNEVIPYDIDAKIKHNKLDAARTLIEDYAVYYPRIARIYAEFDKQGSNRSLSILNSFRSKYILLGETAAADQRFFSVVNSVVEQVRDSMLQSVIPADELSLCVEILVVDAFIRCKIFKNPEEHSDAHP